MFFRSPTIAVHVLRGILGIGFLYVALNYSSELGWWVLMPLAAALLFLGGCPMCWIVGLVDTVLRRKTGPSCVDGSCGPTTS